MSDQTESIYQERMEEVRQSIARQRVRAVREQTAEIRKLREAIEVLSFLYLRAEARVALASSAEEEG